jgi:hypothetical protein
MKKVVHVGNVVVKRELHVKQGMTTDGLRRFQNSQAFQNELAKNKKLIPQNSSQAQKLLSKTGDSDSEHQIDMAQATKTQKQAETTPKKGAKKVETPAPAPAKKGAAKKTEVVEEKGPGKIEQILALHKQGLSNKQIVEDHGFNKTTVSIQVAKYNKAQAEAAEVKKAAKGKK